MIVCKLWQIYLIELAKGKQIRYCRTELRRNFVQAYGNSSAFAHQCHQFGVSVYGNATTQTIVLIMVKVSQESGSSRIEPKVRFKHAVG